MQSFPTELLQTFVAVVDEGSFTGAGASLGLTQSAVTAQIKRLESQAGCALIVRTTRSLSLTAQGDLLLKGAREILELHGSLREQLGIVSQLRGRLRVGISEGYLCASTAEALKRFCDEHPAVQLELHLNITRLLLDQLENQLLDIVVGVHCGDEASEAESLWSEPLVWGFSTTAPLPLSAPLPIVVAPEPCPYRAASTSALSSRRLPWRIACVSPSFSSCLSAARMGLGVVALPRSELPTAQLRDVGDEASLPALPRATLSLWYPRDGASRAAHQFGDLVKGALNQHPIATA